MSDDPIFVVGAPRSGTTLLVSMLASHSRLCCGPETHFFRRLAQVDDGGLCVAGAWPARALEFIATIRHSAQPGYESRLLLEKYGLSPEEVERRLAAGPPSVATMLRSVTEPYMRRMGRARWIEKTPDHLLCLDAIRRAFPDSPIVRIIRDPRDVALSLMKVPWGARSFVEALLHWRRLDEASRSFFLSDRSSYTIHFERVIADPTGELRSLCTFLGEEFEESMLSTAASAGSVNSRDVPWKRKAAEPPDARRIEVWRHELSMRQRALAEAIAGAGMMEYGYGIEGDWKQYGEVYPDLRLGVKFEAELSVIAERGVRFWQAEAGEAADVKVYLGDPAGDGWFDSRSASLLWNTVALSTAILRGKYGDRIMWAAGPHANRWGGYRAGWIKQLLRPHVVRAPQATPNG